MLRVVTLLTGFFCCFFVCFSPLCFFSPVCSAWGLVLPFLVSSFVGVVLPGILVSEGCLVVVHCLFGSHLSLPVMFGE